MGDGGKNGKGFHLNTNAYKTSGATMLINALKFNFDLNCSLHSRDRIYIPSKEMNKFRAIVLPHFLEKFKYKLNNLTPSIRRTCSEATTLFFSFRDLYFYIYII